LELSSIPHEPRGEEAIAIATVLPDGGISRTWGTPPNGCLGRQPLKGAGGYFRPLEETLAERARYAELLQLTEPGAKRRMTGRLRQAAVHG